MTTNKRNGHLPAYTGPAKRIPTRSRFKRIGEGFFPTWEAFVFATVYAAAIAAIFFDLTIWRP